MQVETINIVSHNNTKYIQTIPCLISKRKKNIRLCPWETIKCSCSWATGLHLPIWDLWGHLGPQILWAVYTREEGFRLMMAAWMSMMSQMKGCIYGNLLIQTTWLMRRFSLYRTESAMWIKDFPEIKSILFPKWDLKMLSIISQNWQENRASLKKS